ncbi:MAG: universal stress protein E [Gammaproteobacteria bacterium]|jgi:universal stress protein E
MHQSQLKLFVIIDPTNGEQIALQKALLMSVLTDCEIHAFVCDYEDISEHGEYASTSDMKRRVLSHAREKVELLMEICKENNIHYSTEVVWNKNWYEAAIQAAVRAGSDLILKTSFHHDKATRFFHKTSDYTLMRYCACPILFTHRSQKWHSNRMLACVDLESTDSEHTRLNNGIIKTARVMAETLSMDLTIAAAYEKTIDKRLLHLEKDYSTDITERLANIFGIETENMILRQGPTIETIQDICVETDPSILVIGSIARTGIHGKIIGNTAEKLLDVIEADILTIS